MTSVPISDGGEGFIDCLLQTLNKKDSTSPHQRLEKIDVKVRGALPGTQNPNGIILIDSSTGTAYLEVANLCGLQQIPKDKRDPFLASSYAVGEAMRYCYDVKGIKKFVIGSGGSAFSDAGFGAVRALEVFDFYDHQN